MVTDRAFMRAVFIAFVLSSAFLAVGCKQGLGDRCVQDSDCESGHCAMASLQGGHCASTNMIEPGTGGSTASGGTSGEGGSAGEGGAGGQAGSPDDAGPAGDASRD